MLETVASFDWLVLVDGGQSCNARSMHCNAWTPFKNAKAKDNIQLHA